MTPGGVKSQQPQAEGATASDPLKRLGLELRHLRELRHATLRDVADAAGISAAYVLKLERGAVRAPSPHVLRGIAQYLRVSYLDLMNQAGYHVTDTEPAPQRQGILASALASETLTDAEQRAVAAFLTSLRAQPETS